MGARERENHAIEAYLQYLATGELPVDPQKQSKLEAIDARIAAEQRLYRKALLIAERHEVAAQGATADDLKDGFLKHVGGFMARNPAVNYSVWREMGVPPAVLKEAGIAGKDSTERTPRHYPSNRVKMTPERMEAILRSIQTVGPAATSEAFGVGPGTIGSYSREAAERYPDVVKRLNYNHGDHYVYMDPHTRQKISEGMKKKGAA